MDKITITINGPTGSGKSAIWQVIQQALEQHGISTNSLDQLDTCTEPEIIEARLAHVRARCTVNIVEQNFRR